MKTILKTARDTNLPVEDTNLVRVLYTSNGVYRLGSVHYAGDFAPGNDYISKTRNMPQLVLHDFTANGNLAAKYSASSGRRIYTAYDPANNIDYGMSSNSSLYFGTQDPLSKSHTVGDYRVKSTGSSWVVERCTVGGTWGEGTWIKDCGCGGEIQGDQNIPELNPEPLPNIGEFVNVMKGGVEISGEWDCIGAVMNVIRVLQGRYEAVKLYHDTVIYCINNNIPVINVGILLGTPIIGTGTQLVQEPCPACYCHRYSMYNAYIDANGEPYHCYHVNTSSSSKEYYTVAEVAEMFNNSYMSEYTDSDTSVILYVNNFPCLSLPENQYLIDRYNAIRNQFLSFSPIII